MITGYSRWLSATLIPTRSAADLFAGRALILRRRIGGDRRAHRVPRNPPNVLAINLIGNPSARCSLRISAQSSTDNNSLLLSARKPRIGRRGSKFDRVDTGSVFRRRRQPASTSPSTTARRSSPTPPPDPKPTAAQHDPAPPGASGLPTHHPIFGSDPRMSSISRHSTPTMSSRVRC
jgi:hypothetical protein